MINVVLYQPEIPQNTGNIVRTCAATGAKLHLIKPFGFTFEDKFLKRAGLDYWELAEIAIYEDWEDFCRRNNESVIYYASTKSQCNHTQIEYSENVFVVFGRESKGLPEAMLSANYSHCLRIPMRGETRSLNLANSVAVIVYEYHRQRGFAGLEQMGQLTEY